MKMIWVILLTMVLFNIFLVTFGAFFPKNDTGAADIYGNKNLSVFKTPGQIDLGSLAPIIAGSASLIPALFGLIGTIATKNFQYLAAGGMISLISLLWSVTSAVFTSMFKGNTVLLGIYTAVSLVIGIIVAILVLGILTNQDQLGYG